MNETIIGEDSMAEDSKPLTTEDDNNSVEVANRFIAVGEVIEEIVEAEDPTARHHSKESLVSNLQDDQLLEDVNGKCQF